MADELLTLCLADICRGAKAEQFAADPHGTLAAYGLSPETEAALLRGDVRQLLERGGHPVLTMYFARLRGITPFEYIEVVRDRDS